MSSHHRFRWLFIFNAIGMFIVVVAGALVTKTESGEGCGRSWPSCHGSLFPDFSCLECVIEWSHRAVTGIECLLLVACAIVIYKYAWQNKLARWLMIGAVFFTLLQAFLGMLAVIFEQSSAVMALHFGFSLLANTCTMLLAIVMWPKDQITLQRIWEYSVQVSQKFRYFIWSLLVFCYIIVYLGAFVRHTDSSGGCTGWPLCNGEFVPELTGAAGIAFIHRVGAFIFLLITIILALYTRRNAVISKAIRITSYQIYLFTLMQVVSGIFVVSTLGSDWNILASLLHTFIIAILFGLICYLSLLVMSKHNK